VDAPQRLNIPVAGGELAAFRYGDPAAPAIIAAHGITSHSGAWAPVARALGDRAHLVALDLRGRGRSNALPPPYGTAVHVDDILATLDALALERAILVGHSLGAYIVARVAAEHPERAERIVLVDGGLTIPGVEKVDPQAFADAFLGPAIARLRLTFATREAYVEWWGEHPAIGDGQVAPDDLAEYAFHDLTGREPELHPAPNEAAVRADAGELSEIGSYAHRLALPAHLLCAARGLQNEPNPMQPFALCQAWAAEDPGRRRVTFVPDINHYTITLGAGAAVVAGALTDALTGALAEG
jgi:pimeloyl-ACP methyl ester carboxylesterase